jgi:predicted lipoprotein
MRGVLILVLLCCWQPASADLQQDLLRYIHDRILIEDSHSALHELRRLEADLEQGKGDAQLQMQFKRFVLSWKKVEAAYVAGALNEDLLDHPRYIDHYHQGNESIAELLARALAGNQSLATALFKNSTRGVIALEYLLFSAPGNAPQARRIEAALISVRHIQSWLEEIAEFYAEDDSFVNGGDKSLGLIVNRLIDSSYKLTNWRIGEATGLVSKYQDLPLAERLEYHRSGLSLQAIAAILSIHQRVVDNPDGVGLFELGESLEIGSEMRFVRRTIEQVAATVDSIDSPLKQQVSTPAVEQLFQQLNRLHNAYYFMLIDALGLDSQIIDADGD